MYFFFILKNIYLSFVVILRFYLNKNIMFIFLILCIVLFSLVYLYYFNIILNMYMVYEDEFKL